MVTQAIMARALATTGEHARERLPSTPSAAAQSSQLPASTTLASAPRPRRSRASPTSRPSTLKSQLESLTSQFTALGKQLVTQKVLPSKSSLFNAIFPPAPPVPVTASPTTALPPSAAPEATSPIITQPVT
ncbi:unnamed protein product [Zymoseptoria tritici ST99CH_1E4]|uniref:Uncharacterized protein n=1 Tax=Zymoseptoria tritici ST99CH_1E4 TaxID=1276532 RepID=A0A2H1H8X7_ZYMTR|nr:unnamed protein product [Zymoseptoria tritici ST99CH_1E4]